MIHAQLSPQASTEENVGRKILDSENAELRNGHSKVVSPAERQNAVLAMRYQLSLLDRAERRMSIEEWIDALLSEPGANLNAPES